MPTYGAKPYEFTITGTTGTYSDVSDSITFTLTTVNPCPISSLTLHPNPFPSQSTYVLRDEPHVLPWTSTNDLAFNADTSADCGNLQVEFYHSAKGDLDSVFSVDFDAFEFTVPYTEDIDKAQTYDIYYQVSYIDYVSVSVDLATPFEIIVDDPCDPPAVIEPSVPLLDQELVVATPAKTY